MSRRARRGRHRRRSRTSRTVGAAVPLAVGGVVAGAALVATPFDAGQPRRGDSVAAGPQDRDRGTLITFPSASAHPGTPEPAASAVPTAADRGATPQTGQEAGDAGGPQSTGAAQTVASSTSGNRVQSAASSGAGGGSGDSGTGGSGDGSTAPPPQSPPEEPAPTPDPVEPPVTLPAPLPSLPLPVVSLPALP